MRAESTCCYQPAAKQIWLESSLLSSLPRLHALVAVKLDAQLATWRRLSGSARRVGGVACNLGDHGCLQISLHQAAQPVAQLAADLPRWLTSWRVHQLLHSSLQSWARESWLPALILRDSDAHCTGSCRTAVHSSAEDRLCAVVDVVDASTNLQTHQRHGSRSQR